VAGTDGAVEPFWSPDSQFIGFFADAALKRVGLSADAPRVLAATQRLRPLGGTWSQSDLLLYADQGKVFSVDASGGTPAIALEPDPGPPAELRWPQFLPDGRHFLVSLRSDNPERSGLYLATLGSRDTTRLIGGMNTRVIYSAPGYLLYVRERVLLAQPFDAARGQLQGDPMTVASDVAETAMLSSTAAGLLAFSEETIRGRLVWLSRAGKELGTIDVPKILSNIALSPNNKQLLGSSVEAGNWVMWLIDLDRNVSTQTGAYGSYPAWAPDGSRYAFSSVRAGEGDVFVKSITGATEEVPWLKSDAVKLVNDWSSDGRFIVFTNNKRRDLWLLPTFGERKPMPFTQSVSRARNGKVSPDGRWIAYVSDETGKMEVYVESFPAPGSKQRLSTNGGTQPIWRQDGHELFYLSDDHQMMAVPIQSAGGLQPGKPQPLFSAPDPVRQVVVTRDGHRFLVSTVDPASDQGSITVLTNWQAAQRR
jgi:Tol biopolymer transport system component